MCQMCEEYEAELRRIERVTTQRQPPKPSGGGTLPKLNAQREEIALPQVAKDFCR